MNNPKFAVTYMAEMRALLEVLVKADPALLEQAWEIVRADEQAQLDRWFDGKPSVGAS
jgi:hypothetical protein